MHEHSLAPFATLVFGGSFASSKTQMMTTALLMQSWQMLRSKTPPVLMFVTQRSIESYL